MRDGWPRFGRRKRAWKPRPAPRRKKNNSRRDEEQAQREAEGRQRRGKEPAPIDPTPEDKAQTNFTDPEAKIMKQSNKGFDYSYNAQAVVDGEDQIIVAAEVTNAGQRQATGRADGASGPGQPGGGGDRAAEGGRRHAAPIPNTADTGYFSEKAVEELEKMGMDPHMADGRQKHHEAPSRAASRRHLAAEATSKEKMQAQTRYGGRQSSLRGTQAHRRAGIRADQVGAGNPQVSACEAWRRCQPSGN